MVKVRFAPSPTGTPHIGTIRTALFNYFFAKANNGKFILRIEDTDQARLVKGAEDAIKDSLSWLSIEWDEYIVQSTQLSDYKKYAEELVKKGRAKIEDGGALRFTTPKTGTTSWVDKVGEKRVEFANKDIEDFIILKSDGFPTYHLANVVDDNKEGITHVIRGEDWISSTPKHILLYEAFGWKYPEFVHVPNVLGNDGKKLSKRKEAKGVLDFKNEGFLPEALLNYLMLLGWSPKDDREILSKTEIIKEFTLENINVSPATFDQRKLEWMNGVYIRKSQISNLKSQILQLKPELKAIDDKILVLAQSRMITLNDFEKLTKFIKEKPEIKLTKEEKEIAEELSEEFQKIKDWKSNEIFIAMKKVLEEKKIKIKVLYKIFTGSESGLPLPESLEILGKEKTLERL